MKIRVIDLLNMISIGKEVPKKIKYGDVIYELGEDNDYHNGDSSEYYDDNLLFSGITNVKFFLNDDIEILEDKKIEPLKLNNSDVWTGRTNEDLIADKINEIIDKLNKEK